MTISENLCPVCQAKNELEAVVCGNCGATLNDPFMDPGARTKTTDMQAVPIDKMRAWPVNEATIPRNGIAVYIEGEANPSYVDYKGEFVIGRKMGKTSEPMLDLVPLGGYHLGLSRRHAIIRRTRYGYEVLDLGSVNGTWLNNERLVPHTSYPLASGSHLRVARMRLLVVYLPFAEIQ